MKEELYKKIKELAEDFIIDNDEDANIIQDGSIKEGIEFMANFVRDLYANAIINFQPIEQPQPERTAEVTIERINEIIDSLKSETTGLGIPEARFHVLASAIKKEYVAQFKSQSLPKEEKTAEEILKKHLINTDWGDANDLERELKENRDQVDAIIRAMKEYTSQFKSQSFQLSDGEIEKQFPEGGRTDYGGRDYSCYDKREGAKWYRDQVQINLRGEFNNLLNAIYNWQKENKSIRFNQSKFIDEYLKHKL